MIVWCYSVVQLAVQLCSCTSSIELYKPRTLLILMWLVCITFLNSCLFILFSDSGLCGLTVEKVGKYLNLYIV